MDDLIAFLRARLDEDEAMARSAGAEPWNAMAEETPDGENIYYTVETRKPPRALVESLATGASAQARIDHMARHHPARVLREIEAKRRILRAHEKWCGGRCDAKWPEGGFDAAHYWSIKSLAAVYADHPDYRAEWRP